jgi:tetratricopeptide (TPR) repeat protein
MRQNFGDEAKKAFEGGRSAQAEQLLLKALAIHPTEPLYNLLARLLWLENRQSEFEKLCNSLLTDPVFCFCGVELLRQAEQYDQALNALAALPTDHRQNIRFFLNAAWIYIQLGDGQRAHQCALPAFEAQNSEASADAYVSSLIMMGDFEKAEQILAALMADEAHQGRWMAYQLHVDRILYPEKDGDYKGLIKVLNLQERHPRLYESGFSAALRDAVEEIYRFKNHPLDQSLTGGQQTAANLVNAEAPVLRQYLKMVSQEVKEYCRLSGDKKKFFNGNSFDHISIKECWSVTLDGGHHRPHFHPEGVVSGTYYLTVPGGTEKGTIYFGVPPFSTAVVPAPFFEYEPQEGSLILFPSYFWHGTRKSAAGESRQTLPFDAG